MLDVLVFGAHPDDEVFMGGTIAKLADRGYRIGVCDLTRGECGSRGTPEDRAREAEEAARILGIAQRIALDLGDTQIGLRGDHRLAVVRVLREARPTLVFVHEADDRNPDHVRTNRLVREACFYAYVKGIETGQERFRPQALIEYYGNPTTHAHGATFVVPISETFARKMEAMRAYKSQFFNPEFSGPETFVSSKTFFEQIEARARYWGSLVGENYGEIFRYRGLITIGDPVDFFLRTRTEEAGEGRERDM